jgi:two-component system, NarL family, sensor histidine kinase DesK
MWVYVGAASGFSLPLDRAIAPRALLGSLAGLSVCCVVAHASVTDWLMLMFPTFFAGLTTIGVRRMAYLIAELREAREKVARLAANEERLRLARDLHDLTGHSLSLITLKAELAQRMIERAGGSQGSGDRGSDAGGPSELAPGLAAALKEVIEIEHVSRQTLADIRDAVSGYRRPTLAVEIASACAALDAAGMKLHADPAISTASGTYDPEIEAVLAWCLREAVTNAIRHSKATRVRVGLADVGGELVLTVRNDGVGLAGANGLGAGGEGNGLKGLRERLNAVDGRVSVGGPDGDFRFTAAVPLAA